MHKYILSLALVLLLSIVPDTAYAQCKNCPPFYCENPELAKKALERKKANARSQGLPERLLKLFDRLDKCQGCIENAPDWVHITWSVDKEKFKKDRGREADYNTISMPWSAELEKKIRDDMRKGVVKQFHILHYSGPPCTCCKDMSKKQYTAWKDARYQQDENIPGYNQEFDFHPDVGLSFTNPKRLGKDPKDLTEIPEEFRRPDQLKSPPLDDFMQPVVRVVQVMCKECRKLAKEYNKVGEKLNKMRRPIAKLKRDIHYDRQLVNWVFTEIEGLNKAADTKKTQKHREKLYDELGGHQRSLDRHQKKLKKKLEERAKLEAQLDGLMKQLQDCEENACKPKDDAEEPKDESAIAPPPVKTTSKGGCPTQEDRPMTVGPNKKVGHKADFNKKVKKKAMGMAMGGLMGKAGGGFGIGGGGRVGPPMQGGGQKGPKKDKDPTTGKFTPIKAGGAHIEMRGSWTKEGFVLSTKIKKAPGNGTFQAQWILGTDGKIYFPYRYLLIDLYRKWKLSVWWSFKRWVNGDLVEHRTGDSMTIGSDYLGTIKFYEGLKGMKNSIWHSLGFETALKGANHIGAVYRLPKSAYKGPCPMRVVTHVTEPKKDPVTTVPLIGELFKSGNKKDKANPIILIRPTIVQEAE